MDFTFLYEIQHHVAFGPLIVLYFFLAGLSAGLFLLSSASTVFGQQALKPLAKPSALMALATLIPGVLALIIDLGQPLRALFLFIYVNPTSIMSWGSYILLLYGLVCLLYNWFLLNNRQKEASRWGKIGIVLSLALGLYTGFLLAVVPGKPLWNSGILPLLFLVSGFVAALSLISLTKKVLVEENNYSYELAVSSLKLWFIVLETCLLVFHLLTLFFLGFQGEATVLNLLTGNKAIAFWLGQILLGVIVPIAILLFSKRTSNLLALAGLSSLFGVFALRYNFILGGQELPVSGTMLYQQGSSFDWFIVIALLFLTVILVWLTKPVASKLKAQLQN